MRLHNTTHLDTDRLKAMMFAAIDGWPRDGLDVRVRYSRGAEFSGTALPEGWMSVSWNSPGVGSTTVSGGLVTVDGQRVNPVSLAGYSAPATMEFVAKFQPVNYMQVGFQGGDNSTGPTGMENVGPRAAFGTASGTEVTARSGQSTVTVTTLPGLTGAFHRYRIVWLTDRVEFYVDGVLRATHTETGMTAMRPAIHDHNSGGSSLSVDWLRITPYATSGTFVSRVYDAGAAVNWLSATWTSETPAGIEQACIPP